jgi:hypothetical protein
VNGVRFVFISHSVRNWDSSVSIVTRLQSGRPGFVARQRHGFVLFATASRRALGPTQHPFQWVSGALFLRVKRPGREVDHSPPFSAEAKEYVGQYLHSSNMYSWRSAQ